MFAQRFLCLFLFVKDDDKMWLCKTQTEKEDQSFLGRSVNDGCV